MSASTVLADRMTVRLSKNLRNDKISAVMVDSSTTTDRKLQPTRENGEDAKSNERAYLYLPKFRSPRLIPTTSEPRKFPSGEESPALTRAIRLAVPQVPSTATTCKLVSRYFAWTRSNRLSMI